MAWNEPGNRDPWGHRKDDQGPPDLDEIVRRMQEKFRGLWGNNGGNGDGLGWGSFLFLVLIALIVWGSLGFYVVQPAEQGVVTRFGAYRITTSQGLNWHIPYPIEQVEKVDVEQVRAIQHKALMLTQDENIVEIELVVQYRVSSVQNYLFKVNEPDNTLQHATESALREIVGTSRMDEVLTSERTRVALDTKALIQDIVDRYELGLNVISVNMQNAQPPEAVQEAFADVIKAREDEERLKNKAEAYANEVVQRAGGNADRLRQEAQAYQSQVIAYAEGETKRFLSVLEEYEKAPEVTRNRIYIDAMETVLGQTTQVLVDTSSNNNQLMVLPLEGLLKNIGKPQGTVSTSSGDATGGGGAVLPGTDAQQPGLSDNRGRGER